MLKHQHCPEMNKSLSQMTHPISAVNLFLPENVQNLILPLRTGSSNCLKHSHRTSLNTAHNSEIVYEDLLVELYAVQ